MQRLRNFPVWVRGGNRRLVKSRDMKERMEMDGVYLGEISTHNRSVSKFPSRKGAEGSGGCVR